MFGSLGSGAIGANNLDIRELSSGSLDISVAVAYNAVIQVDSATGAITVGASTVTSASLSELSRGVMLIWSAGASSITSNISSSSALEISSTTDFAFVPHMQGTFYVDSAGSLVLQSFSLFSRGYVRSSYGELEAVGQSVISRTSSRFSVVPLEIRATTEVNTRIYTNVAFDSLVELVLTVNEQNTQAQPRGGKQEIERRSRQYAFLSHARMGTMAPYTVHVEYIKGQPPVASGQEEIKTDPPKRPLGELGRFLQQFGQRKVDYSFDSKTGTVSFWIKTDAEVSNPRTERAQAEQIDEEDHLLLGLSENHLVLDSKLTSMMRAGYQRRQDIEQQDLDILGLGEFN